MPVAIVVGTQWGDEGKGKIIDLLTEKADVVARYQGGHNAGHTVIIEGNQYILHLIPSGIFHPDKLCVIGNGVVIDPAALASEIEILKGAGIPVGENLVISDRANIILPFHRTSDMGREDSSAKGQKIGTTGRGIGPSYADKIARVGVRVCDYYDEKNFREKLRINYDEKKQVLKKLYDEDIPDLDCLYEGLIQFRDTILKYAGDTQALLREEIANNKRILCEGAQGTMLDVDHGTYPFVTSSNSTAGGACTGLGIPPTKVTRAVGVVKAYTTRVGEGPFPTELFDKDGEQLRSDGQEFGSTTGRPRRCGWFDAVIAKYAIALNGLDAMVLTKIDVLDQFETIQVCTGYQFDGKVISGDVPADLHALNNCKPVYTEFKGWKEKTTGITSYDKLPDNAKHYIEGLGKLLGVDFMMLSTGPQRHETICLGELF